ncbi:MAG: tetratricopeptide repeat protein [Methanothrix sp.]|nr:tetratricopeptide repeat protein [Methanothrix sp.]
MKRLYWAEALLLISIIFISGGHANVNNSTGIMCSNLEDCYNQGMKLLSQGNCSEAYDVLQSAIIYNETNNHTNSDVWISKGRAAACMGNFSEAVKCCDVARQWERENAQAYVVKAEALLAQNKTDEARAMMEDAVEKNISDPVLWIECGKVFSRMEMWQDAQKAFNKATDIDINNAEGWYLEAKALQRLGRFEDAILVYNQSVINIDSSNVDAWLGRSQTLEALKLYAEAEKSYSKVLDLDPTNEDALFQKGLMLLLLKRDDEATETLTNLTELAPNNAAAWMRKGLALAKQGRCNDSLASYDKSIELDENNTDAWIGRGDAQLCMGLVNQAQETYEAVLRKHTLNGPAQERMARIYYLNGNYRAALVYAKQSIGGDRTPPANYARAWLTYANALNASDKHDSAIKQYMIAEEKASSASPLDPEIDLRELGWARESVYMHRADHEYHDKLDLNRSDYSHAKDYFQKLTEMNKSDMNAWMMLGICNFKLWQFNKSEECFRQVLKSNPINPTVLEWMARIENERRPHIRLVDFSNGGIIFPSSLHDIKLDWEPPEKIHVKLENLADVDGIAEAIIWTNASGHIKKVRLGASFEIPVQKNSQSIFDRNVRIPWDAFIDPPKDVYNLVSILDFYRAINPVKLDCEFTIKEIS